MIAEPLVVFDEEHSRASRWGKSQKIRSWRRILPELTGSRSPFALRNRPRKPSMTLLRQMDSTGARITFFYITEMAWEAIRTCAHLRNREGCPARQKEMVNSRGPSSVSSEV